MKSNRLRGLGEIHFAVLLFGCSAPLVKAIPLSAHTLVFGRTFFAALSLLLIVPFFKQSYRLRSLRDYVVMLVLGILLAGHWTLFFLAIKLSTVAIGVVTTFTFPIFVALLEPRYFGERLDRSVLLLSLICLLGVLLVIPEWTLQHHYSLGAFCGVGAGLLFAIIPVVNRRYVETYSTLLLNLYQFAFASLAILPFCIAEISSISISVWGVAFIFGSVFTAVPFALFVRSLKTISAQEASLIMYLEPVYGIVIAYFVFLEVPTLRTLLGGAIILGSASVLTVRKVKRI